MLEPINSASTRFVVLFRRVDLQHPMIEVFLSEAETRERWRQCAIAAAIGDVVDGHVLAWARLYSGPSLGNRHDARRLAEAGHLKLIESSSPLTSTAPAKERMSVSA